MLFWEALTLPCEPSGELAINQPTVLCAQRLPFDKRCAAVTKSGKRCKGRIRRGAEHCPLHDPRLVAERRLRPAPHGLRARRRLSHLPDGYLRKLTNRTSVGNAMDRLYRELRLGIVTSEMASVLFNILTRLLDSGLAAAGKLGSSENRSKASRLRPKVSDLLIRSERAAWQRAVANAPASILQAYDNPRTALRSAADSGQLNIQSPVDEPRTVALQIAS